MLKLEEMKSTISPKWNYNYTKQLVDLLKNNPEFFWVHLSSYDYMIQLALYNMYTVGVDDIVNNSWIDEMFEKIKLQLLRKFKNSAYVNYSDLSNGNEDSYKFFWKKTITDGKKSMVVAWFLISHIDSKDKITDNLCNCLSVIACWVSKETWENISFITHQDSSYISWEWVDLDFWLSYKDTFAMYLGKSLEELKQSCVSWTIDVVVSGWNDVDQFSQYLQTLSLIEKTTKQTLWFKPIVLWGPSTFSNKFSWAKTVYFDTLNRKIHYFKEYNSHITNLPYSLKELYKYYKILHQTLEYKSTLSLYDEIFA